MYIHALSNNFHSFIVPAPLRPNFQSTSLSTPRYTSPATILTNERKMEGIPTGDTGLDCSLGHLLLRYYVLCAKG